MPKVKKRKTKSKPKPKPSPTKNATPKKPTKKKKTRSPLFKLPFLARMFIVFMLASTLQFFKKYALPYIFQDSNTIQSPILTNSQYFFNETDFMNTTNLNLHNTESDEISPKITKHSLTKIPLKTWTIKNALNTEIADFIHDILYNEFMNKTKRNELFLFTSNNLNTKIRSNKNIKKRIKNALKVLKNGGFSYCKYEYQRKNKLYQSLLNSLNSSHVSHIISKIIGENVYGITDLFLSIFHKNNFLSAHDGLLYVLYIYFYFEIEKKFV